MPIAPPMILAAPPVSPLVALLIAVGIGAAIALVGWIRHLTVAVQRGLRGASSRVLCEDALKHICKAEARGEAPTLQSVAGTLQVSLHRATTILADMERRRLVSFVDGGPRLTPSGREYALHIIRAHRLWERYLADRTGVNEEEWHERAERLEHRVSPRELRRLADQLGNPSHDPHGAPIPTSEGEWIPHGGVPLPALPVDQPARIVHIEDEPQAIYAQVVAENLRPGMEVRVLERSDERLRFWADGDEHVLAPIVAGNVSVSPLPRSNQSADAEGVSLASLALGQTGRVTSISRACRGVERRRLLDLGIVPGTTVEVAMESPGGDPVAYRIRGALIALRSDQARGIRVVIPGGAAATTSSEASQ